MAKHLYSIGIEHQEYARTLSFEKICRMHESACQTDVWSSSYDLFVVKSRQANKQASRQADKQTSRQADKQTYRQADIQTSRQADKQTSRQADKQTSR